MMPNEYIPIEKDLIPYRFDIELGSDLFLMEIQYNDTHDFFTLDLYKNDEVLVYGEKIVYGVSLFTDPYDSRFPAPTIVPLDESGIESTVTYENLNETVFLYIDNEAGEIE